MPAKTVTTLPGCAFVDINAKFIFNDRSAILKWLDVENVCPLLEHILNTIVDIVSESIYEVFVIVC